MSKVPKNALTTDAGFVGKLPFRTKLFYGLGELNQSIPYTIISMYIMFFFTDCVGISPVVAAAVVMIAKVWDGINNPLMGWISDRATFKGGRRKPFIIFSAVPIALFFILMWAPITFEGQAAKSLFFGSAYFLFATASTMFAIPYYALGMELTDDYSERTSVANIRATVSMLLGLVFIALSGAILDAFDNAPMGYFVLAIIIAVVSVPPILLVYFKIPERQVAPCEPTEAKIKHGFWQSVKSFIFNRPLNCANIMTMMNKMATGIFEGFLVYYATYWLGRGNESTLFLAVAAIFWMLSLPVWKKVGQMKGKRFVYIAVSIVWIIGSLLYLVPGFNSSGIFPYVITSIIGFGYGYARVIPPAMVPDIADYDELKYGRRREGQIYGVWNMFGVFGAAIAMMPVSMVLERVGYVAGAQQSELALNTIRWVMALGPAIPLVIGIIATAAYNISHKKYDQIRQELDRMRTENCAEEEAAVVQ